MNQNADILLKMNLGRFSWFNFYTKHPVAFYLNVIVVPIAILISLLIPISGLFFIYSYFQGEISFYDAVVWSIGSIIWLLFLYFLFFKKRELLITKKGIKVTSYAFVDFHQLKGFYCDNGHLVFIGDYESIFKGMATLIFVKNLLFGYLLKKHGLPISYYLGIKKCDEVKNILKEYLKELENINH